MEQFMNNLQETLQMTLTFSLPVSTILLLALAWVIYRFSADNANQNTSSGGGGRAGLSSGKRSSSGGRRGGSSGGSRRASGLGGGIGSASAGIGSGLGDASKGLGMGLGSTLKGLGEGLGSLTKGIGKGLGDLATGLTKPAESIGHGIRNVIKSVRDETVQDLQWAWQTVSERQAKKRRPLEGQADSAVQSSRSGVRRQALPPNVFDAADIDSAEEIRDLCKAVGINASIDGTYVAIDPHKLKHAESVLAMAGYNVKFPEVEDGEVVLEPNPESGVWEPVMINDDQADGPTWRERFSAWNDKLEEVFLKLQLAWDPRPDGKFPPPPDDEATSQSASDQDASQKGDS